MPGPRVVYHVGAHKTGTSLVQKFCGDNARLLRRHRVAYVRRAELNDLVGWGPTLLESPQLLARRLRSMSRSLRLRDLIVSHENTVGRPFRRPAPSALYPDAVPLVEALADVLRPYRTTVVLSVRPQADFLESYYLQTIQGGKHHSFADWLAGIDLDAISWQPLVASLENAFGPENVRILDFRRIREGQDAYLRRFFALADPGLDLPIEYAPTRNASISERGLDLALDANRFLRTGPERKAMRQFLQTHFSNLDYPRPVLLAPTQRAQLERRYGAEYEELISSHEAALR